MNEVKTIEIDIPLSSGIDLVVGILIIVGAVFGYKRGVIVECISFFAVLVLLTICVNIDNFVYTQLNARSSVPDLFAIVFMAVCFSAGLIFIISRITFRTTMLLKDSVMQPTVRYLGAFFGALKYYLICAVFLVTLFKIEEHAKYMPKEAKFSRLSRGSIDFATAIFPDLNKPNKSNPKPFVYPNGEK